MSFNADSISPYLSQLKTAKRCYVAYSGGLDSHVLLYSLTQVLGASNVIAVHVNHQLSDNSDDWVVHCQQQCALLGVELIAETVVVTQDGLGLEQAAREARYWVFERLLGKNDLLLMAHHADDQVETVLYRLLRGTGVKGLAGIPAQRRLGRGQLLRPLLNYRRTELEEYARQQHLCWVDDESNFAIDFDRNFIRHQIIPAIAGRWRDYTDRISHTASLSGEANELLNALACGDIENLKENEERQGWSIALPELLDLSVPRRANLLRSWVASKGLVLPGHRVLETIEHELLMAREDAMPIVSWRNVALRRYRERVYLVKVDAGSLESADIAETQWQLDIPLKLPGGGVLTAERVEGNGLKLPEGGVVTVSYRQGGERCHPAGRSASNTLKKLLQEVGLEPWLRGIVPLVHVDGQLAAVGDLWICHGFLSNSGEPGWQFQWRLS